METILLNGNRPEDVERAGCILRAGGLVGIPTETVYGLAADALNPAAVERIFAAKGRPADNPLIVHIAELSQWAPLVRELPEDAFRLAEAFWPGPLTVILPKSDLVPAVVSGGLDTVAVRFPAHPAAQAVIRAAGVPLAAPSANLSGRPSPTTFAHLREHMEGRADALLDGGDCGVGVESTVVTLAGERPRLLRPGGITYTQLQSVLGAVDVDDAVLHQMKNGEKAASPGMKYKHYAPRAEVILVDASPEDYSDYVNSKGDGTALCFTEDLPLLRGEALSYGSRWNRAEQARELFAALHRLDERGAETVYAHMPSKSGMGLAVYNRLIRAAGFRTVNPKGRWIVGLTGPTGSGKSTVGACLAAAGWAVIDCDELSRGPGVYDAHCVAQLQAAFGGDVARGGVIDRKLVAARAFGSPGGKQILEEITFPRILSVLRREVDLAFQAGRRVAALDAPTLFEAGLDSACARILAVTAPEEVRLSRITARDGISIEQARQRILSQYPEEYYCERADWVVENTGAADALSRQIASILREMEALP